MERSVTSKTVTSPVQNNNTPTLEYQAQEYACDMCSAIVYGVRALHDHALQAHNIDMTFTTTLTPGVYPCTKCAIVARNQGGIWEN
jgi:hypothetical protein